MPPAATIGIPRERTRLERSRPRRVLVLLLAIVVLSIADLIATITHMTTIGMVEANPIARWLVQSSGSTWPLVVFKFMTVGLCVSVLFSLRRHLQGELASWLALAVLVGLCFVWRDYSAALDQTGYTELMLADADHGDWILIGP